MTELVTGIDIVRNRSRLPPAVACATARKTLRQRLGHRVSYRPRTRSATSYCGKAKLSLTCREPTGPGVRPKAAS